MNRRLGSLQERSNCAEYVGMLACWGALGRRLNLVVYMYKYEYRFKDAGGATPGQQRGGTIVCPVSVARALCSSLYCRSLNSPAGPNGQSQLETRVITWVKSKSRLFPVFSNRTSCVCAKLIWLPRHIYHRFCGPVTMCCVVVDGPVGHTSVHSDREPRLFTRWFTASSRPVHSKKRHESFPP
jgi:hypothetical protein